MTERRTKVPKAEELIKNPYPHRTPQEQAEDALMGEMDEGLKAFGIEKKEGA